MLARKQIPLAHSISPATEGILSATVGAVLWQLAAPNVVAVAMMTGLTFADAWYISQLGTAALASAALVFPFLTLMQMTAGGAIGGGVTSAVARAFGAGDLAKAEAVAWHAMLIAAGLSTFYMLLLGLFARPIFALLGGEGAALDGAVQYAQIVFGGAAATWFVFVVSAIHRGTGDTATPGRTITIAAAAQIALSGALTLGWFGLPAMGIQGTAAAWVVCQGVAAIYLTSYLMLGKGRILSDARKRQNTPPAPRAGLGAVRRYYAGWRAWTAEQPLHGDERGGGDRLCRPIRHSGAGGIWLGRAP